MGEVDGSLMDGLTLVFDPALDGPAWPGVLDGRTATAGEAWYGPLGLLGRLETELGLGGQHASTLLRAAALTEALAGVDGWWRESYEADALGTCARLLQDRDLLAMWGWRGEAASARLEALWSATVAAPAGLPDRLEAVRRALAHRRPDIATIELATPVELLEPAWARVLEALAATGVALRTRPVVLAASTGDLAQARTRGFTPTGDGSLTLLRPHGVLAAADEVAANLAAAPTRAGVLIVGGDEVLDAALHRHGLPRTGAGTSAPASTALVRLVIAAAFEPMDPADLHALLCADPGPIPRPVARSLVRALRELPSRRAPPWSAALDRGLARCDDDRRADLAERVATLLVPAARRDQPIAAAEVVRRLRALGAWARGRMRTTPGLVALVQLVADACALIGGEGPRTLVVLDRLCDELEGRASRDVVAEVGLAAVSEPGAVLAPADTIVWWGFTRDRAPTARRLRLSRAERAGLQRLGVTPPDLGQAMVAEAARWRRPLLCARARLVLVCPQTSDVGEPSFPHPLWDELRAVMSAGADPACLERVRLSARRGPASLAPLPRPVTTVQAPGPIALRATESPSSLERLLGCSLAWTLSYPGRLRDGLSAGPGVPTALLYGTLAHHVLAEVFRGDVRDPAAAAARARDVVERDLGLLCESLALPRYQVELTALKHAIVATATELGRLLARSGATVRGVEVASAGACDGVALEGKADLILAGPDVVIDLKWGATTPREKLASGTALQLAAYAAMQPAPHQVAYFTLQSQELLGPPGCTLPGVKTHGTATAADTWRGATVALAVRRTQLAAGVLVAPGADGTEVEARLTAGGLELAPSCIYCGLGTLCGKRVCT